MDIKEKFDGLKYYWKSLVGLVVLILILVGVYYTTLNSLLKESFVGIDKFIFNFIVPLALIMLVYFIWSIKSYRLNLYKKRKITTGLFFRCDDYNSQVKISNIITEMITEIEDEFKDIKLKFFSMNFVKDKKELEKFIKHKNHIIDNALFANIHNGNYLHENQSTVKIEIKDLCFSGNFHIHNDIYEFKNDISLSKDLSLRNLNKKWDYIDLISFDDKLKIKLNLKDSLLFYSGLYLIYMKEFDIALQVFKSLKKSENKNPNNDNLSRLKNGRLNLILVELFSFNAIKKYLKDKDAATAFKLFKECEIIFKDNHPFAFSNTISLSRIYYEKGMLKEAYEYTELANNIRKDSSVVYCNRGFFGMIENNIEKVYINYKELARVYKFKKEINFVEIISFLELHKHKYPDSIILFEFCIAEINFLYADKDLGRIKLIELKEKLNDNQEYVKIYQLINLFLTKGSIKSPYYNRNKKSKKR